MSIDALLAQVRANLAAKLAQRNTQTEAIEAVRSACLADNGREPTETEAATVRSAQEVRTGIDAEIPELQARIVELEAEKRSDEAAAALSREIAPTGATPANREASYGAGARIGREERTYNPETSARGVSWFSDAWHNNQRSGGSATIERLQRHAREVEVEGQITQRAASTGSFAGLVPPQYLLDLAAPVLRAGRPFANSIGPSLPLPDAGMTFQIPRGTTGASVAVQATENSSVSATDEVWANLTVNVATAAGQADVSRQSLDRGYPGTDALIFMDLAGAYGVALDQQCLSGSGSSGQALGVLNTAGIFQASAYAAAIDPQAFYRKVAGAKATITTLRTLKPNAMVLAPRRWGWLESQFDTAGRPLAVPNPQGPMNAFATLADPQDLASVVPSGSMLTLPIIEDASVPITVGAASEDQAIIYRREDLILWEDGDGTPQELRFEQTLGNQLTIKLVVAGYFAFTAGRYPQAVAVIGGNSTAGNGQVAPTF